MLTELHYELAASSKIVKYDIISNAYLNNRNMDHTNKVTIWGEKKIIPPLSLNCSSNLTAKFQLSLK